MLNDYIRITQALSPFSGLSHIPEQVLANAAERGQRIHQICDAIIDGIGTDVNPLDSGYVESFNRWMDSKKFIEKVPRLYCDKHLITGEIDRIYKEKGDLVLVDFKTSAKEGKTWYLQGSAYAYLCRLHGYDISRIEFIQLSKQGHDAQIYCYKENFEKFLNRLEIYREYFQNEHPDDYLQYI